MISKLRYDQSGAALWCLWNLLRVNSESSYYKNIFFFFSISFLFDLYDSMDIN